jgi:uncharacterized protein
LNYARTKTLTAWFHLTEACNLRCAYCYVQKSPQQLDLAVGQKAVAALVRSAQKHHFNRIKIKFAGGEPVLLWHTLTALQEYAANACSAAGLFFSGVVLTNGTLIQEYMVAESRRLALSYSISLDGLEYFHNQLRPFAGGQGSFATIKKTIEQFLGNRIPVNISITLTRQNYLGLPDLVQYLAERKILFSLNFFREHPDSATNLDFIYEAQGLIAVLQTTYQIISQYPPYFRPSDRLLDRVDLSRPHLRPCGVGESYLVVGVDGSISGCQMAMDTSFTTVEDTDPVGTMLEKGIDQKNPPVIEKVGCMDCEWRFWCAGGCPLLGYQVYGRYDTKSPYCDVYKALMKEVLRLEARQFPELFHPQM